MSEKLEIVLDFLEKRNPALYKALEGEHPDVFEDEEPMPPTPDDVALTAFQGLLVSGNFDPTSPDALARQAWTLVPTFYNARQWYAQVFAPAIFAQPATSDEHAESETEA